MSELTAAMKAAVDSLDTDTPPRRAPSTTRPTASSGRVALRHDEDALPTIARQAGPSTFGAALRETFGPVAAAAWVGVREGFLLVVTFWVAAILIAFAVPELATLPTVLTATVILRLVLLLASWSGQADHARR